MTEKETCKQCIYKKLCYLEGVPEECKKFMKTPCRPWSMRKRRTRETIENASQVLNHTRTFEKDENGYFVEYAIPGAILFTLCDISITLGMIADKLREMNEENNIDLAKWMNADNPEGQQNDV